MFSDQPHSPFRDTPESRLRFGMMFAEFWHEWLETMSQVAYQTHKACEFFAENSGPGKGLYEAFDPRAWRGPPQGPNGSFDMDKLKQCLQSMEPMQAMRVMYAVQMMEAMEAMLKRKRSRTDEAEGAPW